MEGTPRGTDLPPVPTSPLIDVPQVIEDLQAIVAEKGDGYVYPRGEQGACEYVRSGEPSCIVGHVLARRNLLHLNVVQCNEGLNATGGFEAALLHEDPLNYAPPEMFRHFTPGAVALLAVAQSVQDERGRTWGEALVAAKEAAEVSA